MPEGRRPLHQVISSPGVWLAIHGATPLAHIYFKLVGGFVYRLYIRGY